VTDVSGNVSWDIAGRWRSQLVARRAGDGFDDLQPDASIPTERSATTSAPSPEYILLWKNSEKPDNTPFNLTPVSAFSS
jgi:hypothetical protein